MPQFHIIHVVIFILMNVKRQYREMIRIIESFLVHIACAQHYLKVGMKIEQIECDARFSVPLTKRGHLPRQGESVAEYPLTLGAVSYSDDRM